MSAAAPVTARALRRPLVALGLCYALFGACSAAALRPCETPARADAEQQDKLLRLAALVKAELEQAPGNVALISRSGIDLTRFGHLTSHAGVALRHSRNAPWSVRQLYYDCAAQRPRIFDQGIAGFLLGDEGAAAARVSVVLLPDQAGAALERAALDDALAVALLGARYSANAYPFSPRYQNCNQWVAELMAASWGLGDAAAAPTRDAAQRWLHAQGYEASVFDAGNAAWLWHASAWLPLVHADDHPREDLEARRYRVSMPAAIESFVAAQVPGAVRIEFCRAASRVTVHRGWDALGAECAAGAADRLLAID